MEHWFIVALIIVAVAQYLRAEHYKREHTKANDNVVYYREGLRNVKDQWNKAEGEARALRGLMAERIRYELTQRLEAGKLDA